jgi:DNA replication ATP-dependent helicase Dna2
MSIFDVRSAIKAELDATPEFYDFKVQKTEREGKLWRVFVYPGAVHADGGPTRVVLDDSFDGSSVWWAEPRKGNANVLVVPEEDQIVLKDASETPPGPDQLIRLYPPRYLDALLECWRTPDWASKAFACLDDLNKPVSIETNPLSGHSFRWLRKAQRRALKLVQYSSSFLWGPPGTGKTTCLGVILAEYLHVNPRARILMLSTTNHAVDLAMVALDKAIEHAKRDSLRETVKRIGTRFIASNYTGREHLLPVIDCDLIARLAKVESARPSSSDISVFSTWAEEVDRLRKEVRKQSFEVIRTARLVGMTTTRAIFDLTDLKQLPVFDLVVFDEASQVGLAHALALMPLGKSRLFAGDPQQLSPVVRSHSRESQRWIARTPFAEKPQQTKSVCMLDEQSRMAGPICQVVSHIFYGGVLRVAVNALENAEWAKERQFAFSHIGEMNHVYIENVIERGTWSQHHQGPIRYQSAEMIADLLSSVITPKKYGHEKVIVITPFRAQRALLQKQLTARGLRHIKVSTVHRSQGTEASVVIFDPVNGDEKFLQTEEARRLINVALSRAKAKLILFLSSSDLQNPIFFQISNIVRFYNDQRPSIPIADLINQVGFPNNALGKRVKIDRHIGEVSRVSGDSCYLYMINILTGAEQCFNVQILRRNASA